MSCTICLSAVEKNEFNCRQCTMTSHLSCMLEWNKILRKTSCPMYFTCPICKIGMNMSVFNYKSGRYVYKFSRLGKSLIERYKKIKDPKNILNLKTNRVVKRTSKLGKKLVGQERKKSLSKSQRTD